MSGTTCNFPGLRFTMKSNDCMVLLLSDTTCNKYLPCCIDTATLRDQSHTQSAFTIGMVFSAVLPVPLQSFCVAKQWRWLRLELWLKYAIRKRSSPFWWDRNAPAPASLSSTWMTNCLEKYGKMPNGGFSVWWFHSCYNSIVLGTPTVHTFLYCIFFGKFNHGCYYYCSQVGMEFSYEINDA